MPGIGGEPPVNPLIPPGAAHPLHTHCIPTAHPLHIHRCSHRRHPTAHRRCPTAHRRCSRTTLGSPRDTGLYTHCTPTVHPVAVQWLYTHCISTPLSNGYTLCIHGSSGPIHRTSGAHNDDTPTTSDDTPTVLDHLRMTPDGVIRPPPALLQTLSERMLSERAPDLPGKSHI